jgi:RNA polymerase sigma factor (sigma-70 family)
MPPQSPHAVYLVDDDPGVRDSLTLLLRLHGYLPVAFASGEAFLDAVDAVREAVVLLDLRLSGMSGADVQHALHARGLRMPVIMVTAHGDAASARNALKAGAFDFIEKPIDDGVLLHAIETAVEADRGERANAQRRDEITRRLARLTPREQQVLSLVVNGRHNREIAAQLGISARTVEVYKARLMDKLDTERLPDLIRLAIHAGIE